MGFGYIIGYRSPDDITTRDLANTYQQLEGIRFAMGLGLILFSLTILIALTFFIVFIVKTARQWGALHVILLSILFIESWVFLYFTAGVQYERVRATRDTYKFREEAVAAIERGRVLRFGKPSDPADSLEAVIPVQGQLERLTIDRGRVWRQLTFANANIPENRIQLVLQATRPSATEGDGAEQPVAAAPQSSVGVSLPQELVVYAFEEKLTEEGYPLPVYYLGEYRVTRSDPATGEIDLTSTLPLDAIHRARIEQGAASWTLYEMLPIDSHTAFSAAGSLPNDETIFGRPDEEDIRKLMQQVPESLVNSYLKDGQKATDDDRPETIWEQIKLLAEYEIDVDSDQNADASVSGYYDQVGRSIDVRLKRNEPVILVPDQLNDNRIVVLENVARDMISRGLAERIQRIYVRPLNDYLGLFNNIHAKRFELDERVKYYDYQNQLMDQANQAGQNMLTVRQKENQLLSADLNGFQKEIQFLNSAVVQADAELEKLKQDLSKLYRAIHDHHRQVLAGG